MLLVIRYELRVFCYDVMQLCILYKALAGRHDTGCYGKVLKRLRNFIRGLNETAG